jgi:hypothetical protein
MPPRRTLAPARLRWGPGWSEIHATTGDIRMPTLRNLFALSCLCAATGLALAQSAPKKAAPEKAPAAAEKGRDWSRIDTNKDGLISPEEMEKYLADNPGPLRK